MRDQGLKTNVFPQDVGRGMWGVRVQGIGWVVVYNVTNSRSGGIKVVLVLVNGICVAVREFIKCEEFTPTLFPFDVSATLCPISALSAV